MEHFPEGLWGADELEARLDPVARLWRVANWEYDRDSDVVYWFDAPLDVLSLTEEGAEKLLAPILVSLRHGAPWEHYDLDRTLTDVDGDPVDLRVQARPIFAPDGHVTGCVGIVTDVSEQRRTEQALRGVIDRYRRLVELNPDPVVVHQDGIVRYMNPAGLLLSGSESLDQFVGRPILDFFHPSSLEETLERIAALTEPGMVSEPAEAMLIGPGGVLKPVESISVRIEWEGRPAYQVILRDISERRRAEAALRYQASLVTHVSDAVIATDRDGNVRSWNPAAESLYGWQAADASGKPLAELIGGQAVHADGTTRSGEVVHKRADGSSLVALVSVAPLRDELGDETGTVAVCTDLTERLKRRAAEARYAAVVAALEEGILVVSSDGLLLSFNRSAQATLGGVLSEGMPITEMFDRWPLVTEDGRPMATDAYPLMLGLRTGQPQRRVVVGLGEGNDRRWLSVSVHPLASDPVARTGAVVCSFSDITDRKRAEEELNFQATHDPLTRLPNRDLVLKALAVVAAGDGPGGAALLLVDLDRFKLVNDAFGHVVGDQVLEQVASRIAGAIRPDDLLGRLAADEFVVVCPGITTQERARQVGDRIARALITPVRMPSGRDLVVTASIGIACVSAGEHTPELVLSHADIAMNRAKELGRARIEIFDDELRSVVSRSLVIVEDLRAAIDAGEITAAYQPIVSATTGDIVGAEVLARWHHHALGDVPPAEFIAIAEDTGLMATLGARVLEDACTQMARSQREGRSSPDANLHVNVSAHQLADPGFAAIVAEALQSSAFDADRLWLEVTESVFVDEAGLATTVLAELRELGVHIAIDDFGTGYSSLAYLKRLPVEALKIDGSFIAGLGSDAESDAIVVAIIRLAQSLHLRTIAEGVETQEQLTRLQELGCDLLQGFLLSTPQLPDELSLSLGYDAPSE